MHVRFAGTHWVKPNLLMHPTPVCWAIKPTIPKDSSITKSPIIAQVRVFLAPSARFGSPAEVTNLNPEIIISTKATIPAKTKSQKITLPTIIGKQPRVTTFPCVLGTVHVWPIRLCIRKKVLDKA